MQKLKKLAKINKLHFDTMSHYELSIILLAPYAIMGAWIAIQTIKAKRRN